MPELKLLDYIAQTSHIYLSDLHQPGYQRLILPLVLGLEDNEYSMDDWNDLLGYLFSGQVCCSTVDEAKEYLLKTIG